jgi:hypothetical protein
VTIAVRISVMTVTVVIAAGVSVLSATDQSRAGVTVRAIARAFQPGELVVLNVTTAAAAEAVRVRGMGREFPAFSESPTAWRALVGIDLDVKPGRYDLSVSAGSSPPGGTTYRLVVTPKAFATRRLTVDPAFVNPPVDVQSRIQADVLVAGAALVRSVRASGDRAGEQRLR